MSSLKEIGHLGQSVWLDNLSRTLIRENALLWLMDDEGVTGVTSNPSIFEKALSESLYYRDDLLKLQGATLSPEQRFEALAVADIQMACDVLAPVYERTQGDDGYVSLEVSPYLAYDEAGTVSAGQRLWREVNRPNALIKVPATREGVKAFETLIAAGINVNVTLMFSLHHVLQVAQAYLRGVRSCVEGGGAARRVKAVASVFLSRVDSLVDKQLEAYGSTEALALRGKAAVSMAKVAYQRYKDLFHGVPFAEFKDKGVRPQYLLWASTGTKNPAYSDVLYVEELIGPETINTMPNATLAAFRDHGKASLTLEQGVEDARQCLIALKDVGVDMHAVGEQLQVEGVQLFEQAFAKLLDKVAETSSMGVTAHG